MQAAAPAKPAQPPARRRLGVIVIYLLLGAESWFFQQHQTLEDRGVMIITGTISALLCVLVVDSVRNSAVFRVVLCATITALWWACFSGIIYVPRCPPPVFKDFQGVKLRQYPDAAGNNGRGEE
jgi:hypothetical protein